MRRPLASSSSPRVSLTVTTPHSTERTSCWRCVWLLIARNGAGANGCTTGSSSARRAVRSVLLSLLVRSVLRALRAVYLARHAERRLRSDPIPRVAIHREFTGVRTARVRKIEGLPADRLPRNHESVGEVETL